MFKSKVKIEMHTNPSKGIYFLVMRKKDFFSKWEKIEETKKLKDAVEFASSLDESFNFNGLYKEGILIAEPVVLLEENKFNH